MDYTGEAPFRSIRTMYRAPYPRPPPMFDQFDVPHRPPTMIINMRSTMPRPTTVSFDGIILEEVVNTRYHYPSSANLSAKQKILLDNFWSMTKRNIVPKMKQGLEKISRALEFEIRSYNLSDSNRVAEYQQLEKQNQELIQKYDDAIRDVGIANMKAQELQDEIDIMKEKLADIIGKEIIKPTNTIEETSKQNSRTIIRERNSSASKLDNTTKSSHDKKELPKASEPWKLKVHQLVDIPRQHGVLTISSQKRKLGNPSESANKKKKKKPEEEADMITKAAVPKVCGQEIEPAGTSVKVKNGGRSSGTACTAAVSSNGY